MPFQELTRRLRHLVQKRTEADALQEEMQLHRELLKKKLAESGTSGEEAERLSMCALKHHTPSGAINVDLGMDLDE